MRARRGRQRTYVGRRRSAHGDDAFTKRLGRQGRGDRLPGRERERARVREGGGGGRGSVQSDRWR